MTDPEDHKTVWEACKHPLAEQEVIEKSCPTVFVSKLGLMVLVIFQIFIYIAFLPHWSICQEHKEVKVTFEKLHTVKSQFTARAIIKTRSSEVGLNSSWAIIRVRAIISTSIFLLTK